jgi:hypothetical protein
VATLGNVESFHDRVANDATSPLGAPVAEAGQALMHRFLGIDGTNEVEGLGSPRSKRGNFDARTQSGRRNSHRFGGDEVPGIDEERACRAVR